MIILGGQLRLLALLNHRLCYSMSQGLRKFVRSFIHPTLLVLVRLPAFGGSVLNLFQDVPVCLGQIENILYPSSRYVSLWEKLEVKLDYILLITENKLYTKEQYEKGNNPH